MALYGLLGNAGFLAIRWLKAENKICNYIFRNINPINFKKKLHWPNNWTLIENLHFLLNYHETWSKLQAHE